MGLSFRAELRPTPRQRQALLQHAGNARWAYNWGLGKHQEAHQKWVSLGKPPKWDGWPNAISLHRELNLLKKKPLEEGGIPWMYEVSKCAPQEALRDLDRAFKNFRTGRAKFPRFKSRSRGVGGFRVADSVNVEPRTVQLPRIGKIRLQPGEQGYLPIGAYAQASVTEHAGRWFVSIVGPEVPVGKPNNGPAVGLDLGVARLATLSDGTIIENPRALASGQKKIEKLQKVVSRKKKGSKNRSKARAKLTKAHARVANVRRDALHKATTTIAKSHSKVVVEDLRVKAMTRRGHGKRGLNRVMQDVAFGEFRRLLEYKGKLYNCQVAAVPPQHTSQRCSACGHVSAGNRRSQAEFQCLSCEFSSNADLNAAKNILVAASSSETENACGEDVRPGQLRLVGQTSMKQEHAGFAMAKTCGNGTGVSKSGLF